MDAVWVGRKLMQAAPALQNRLYEESDRAGPAALCIGPIAGNLLHQVGVFLILQESDYRRPFSRTRGVLRFKPELTPNDLAVAWNVLIALTMEYMENLPGTPPEVLGLARMAIRHAGSESLLLLQAMRGGLLSRAPGAFGGAPLLGFQPRRAAGQRKEKEALTMPPPFTTSKAR